MKISKEKLKQIIKEELEMSEADDGMRNSTAYVNNPDLGSKADADQNRALTAREAEERNRTAFRILEDIRGVFMRATEQGEVSQDDPMFNVLVQLKGVYETNMSKLRNEDPEVISVRQPNYPSSKD